MLVGRAQGWGRRGGAEGAAELQGKHARPTSALLYSYDR